MGFHRRPAEPPTRALCPVNPSNGCHLRLTAAAGTKLAVASSLANVSRQVYCRHSSRVTEVYDPRAFILHAASLRQTFVHCGRFSTAASRRSPGSVSVPMWPINLSVRLPVVALVSRYLTNKLIGYGPLNDRELPPFIRPKCLLPELSGISSRFQLLSPSQG